MMYPYYVVWAKELAKVVQIVDLIARYPHLAELSEKELYQFCNAFKHEQAPTSALDFRAYQVICSIILSQGMVEAAKRAHDSVYRTGLNPN